MAYAAIVISEPQPQAFGQDPARQQAMLREVRMQGERNNRALGVRSLLLAAGTELVQWLEGDEPAVRDRLERISADDRHGHVQLLHAGPCTPLLTEPMGVLCCAPGADGLADSLQALRDGALPVPTDGHVPAAITRSLVKPGPSVAALPRIGLFGQSGVWAGALMAHLQARWQSPLRRTLSLDGLGPEREAVLEYAVHDSQALGRLVVVNYGTELLTTPWMQQQLAPMRLAVMLAGGGDIDALQSHARAVLAQLRGVNARVPLLVLLGRNAVQAWPALARQLAGSGRRVHWQQVPLADAGALWDAVVEELSSLPEDSREADVESQALRTWAGPAQALVADTPAEVDSAPAADPMSREAAQAVLARVLRVDGVAGAALLPPAGTPLMQAAAMAALRRLQAEAQAWSSGPWPPEWREPGWQWLTRWQDHLSMLRRLSGGELLLVTTQPGYVNETWLRVQLDETLNPA